MIQIFPNFFFSWRISIKEHIFCYWHFLITSIFKSLYLVKWCPIFDNSPLTQFSKFNTFLWVWCFLGKNISNFVPTFENSTTRIAILWVQRKSRRRRTFMLWLVPAYYRITITKPISRWMGWIPECKSTLFIKYS